MKTIFITLCMSLGLLFLSGCQEESSNSSSTKNVNVKECPPGVDCQTFHY